MSLQLDMSVAIIQGIRNKFASVKDLGELTRALDQLDFDLLTVEQYLDKVEEK